MEARRIELGLGSHLVHTRGWLDSATAERWFLRLRAGCAWQARSIVLFGREVLQPRLVAWYGELPYRYSGQTLAPVPLPEDLNQLLLQVSSSSEAHFNHLLLNRYRSGADSMGLHADDEPELGACPLVATLSLGAARRFVLRRGKQRVFDAELASGDLLFMGGRCQHEFKHELPKQRSVSGERISLTFRCVLRAPCG